MNPTILYFFNGTYPLEKGMANSSQSASYAKGASVLGKRRRDTCEPTPPSSPEGRKLLCQRSTSAPTIPQQSPGANHGSAPAPFPNKETTDADREPCTWVAKLSSVPEELSWEDRIAYYEQPESSEDIGQENQHSLCYDDEDVACSAANHGVEEDSDSEFEVDEDEDEDDNEDEDNEDDVFKTKTSEGLFVRKVVNGKLQIFKF